MKDFSLDENNYPKELVVLQKELTSSLKFHHGQSLRTLPLELSIQAIVEAWHSCNKPRRK